MRLVFISPFIREVWVGGDEPLTTPIGVDWNRTWLARPELGSLNVRVNGRASGQQDIRKVDSSNRSWHESYLQTLCFCESGLTLVGSKKNLAFERQGARDMEEIYSPSTGFLGMRRR